MVVKIVILSRKRFLKKKLTISICGKPLMDGAVWENNAKLLAITSKMSLKFHQSPTVINQSKHHNLLDGRKL